MVVVCIKATRRHQILLVNISRGQRSAVSPLTFLFFVFRCRFIWERGTLWTVSTVWIQLVSWTD